VPCAAPGVPTEPRFERYCDSLISAFWSGIDAHAKAAEVWKAHMDQSR
jgi:hypothetical protein